MSEISYHRRGKKKEKNTIISTKFLLPNTAKLIVDCVTFSPRHLSPRRGSYVGNRNFSKLDSKFD